MSMEENGKIDRTERQLLVDTIARMQDAYEQLGIIIKSVDTIGMILRDHSNQLDDHGKRLTNLEGDVKEIKEFIYG